MLYGAVLWMPKQGGGPYMFLIGLALTLYVMYAWWADVVAESQDGDHTPVVRIGLRYGFIMFIMSEVMFFAAWFWSFFKHAMYPMGPQSPASCFALVLLPLGRTTRWSTKTIVRT